jgi:TolA-binding protein
LGDPNNLVARNRLAETFRKVGRFEDAIAQYQQSLQQFPSDLVARTGLAEALREAGRLDEAITEYRETAVRFPNDSVAWNRIAETLREAGRLDEAITEYRETAARFPNDPVAFNGLAEALREAGRLEEAIAVYRQTIERFPEDRVARNGLAQTPLPLREAGRNDETLAQSEERVQVGDHLEATVTRKHSTAPFYSDHPARRDILNRKAVAETIATMVENVWKEDAKEENIDRTFMVHLHGRWGSGKTSILNFLRDALLSQRASNSSKKRSPQDKTANPSWVVVDYNAWRNQSLGPAWWTLMEAVYRQARGQLGGWLRPSGLFLIVRDHWWRIRSSYAPYAFAAVLALTLALSLIWLWRATLHLDDKDWLINGLKLIGSIVGVIVAVLAFGYDYRIGSARTAKSYLELSRDPLSPLTKRYGELVADIGRPVAVFVDDLDRCNAEFVVELLQTIQTLFRNARVLYVVAADRDWVCASYQQQYKLFGDTIGEPGKSLGHLFLEKSLPTVGRGSSFRISRT